MIIVAGGDSFTFGAELADQVNGRPSNNTIPALLARTIDAEYACVAESGNANNAIARQVMNYCETNKSKQLFVFVMWSFTHRYEFRFNYNTGRRNTPWYSMNLWDIVDNPDSLREQFVTFDHKIFDSHVNNKKILDSVGLTDFVKTFYKHVGNNEFYEAYSTLKEVVFLQNYLKINGIPYLFCPADDYLRDSPTCTRHINDVSMKSLYNQIDWENWFVFPPGSGPNQTNLPRGFYQWAIENKYPVGTTHPLERAHADASHVMQEKFNELVKKSI